MANHQIDDRIREALAGDDEVQVPGELFARIKSGAAERENKGFGREFTFSGFYSRRKLLVSLFGFLVLFILFGMCFEDVRVLAGDMIGKIKTIFVVEKTFIGYRVVEKPADEIKQGFSVCRGTNLLDSELSKKVGYHVFFPEALDGGFTLHYKALGVTLRNPVGYNLGRQLQSSMLKALQDDDELAKLKEYNPERDVFGRYVNDDGVTVFININLLHANSEEFQSPENEQNKVIDIGNTKWRWVKFPYAEYPMKTENGIGGSDMSQKPTKVRISHSLHWEANGLDYSLNFYNGNELTKKKAIKVAASFMERQM